MYHIAYIDPDHRSHFVFKQIGVLLRARGLDNGITYYLSLHNAQEKVPFVRPDIALVNLRAVESLRLHGLQLVRALRMHPLCSPMTLIGMAEYALPADESMALSAGCNYFIPKPLRYQAVENVVMDLLFQQAIDAPDRLHRQSESPNPAESQPARV